MWLAREQDRAHSPLLNLPSASTLPQPLTLPPQITTTEVEAESSHETPGANVHGYISCSSSNNIIEINLRFPKCKCPIIPTICNGGNNSKEITTSDNNIDANSEIKTKIINFDRNNLSNIIDNLDINTCTKCSISVEVKKLLTRIFSNPALNTINNHPGHMNGDSVSLLSVSPRFSDSNISATDNDDFIIFNLNKEKRNSVDKRSTGTQHEESYDGKSPVTKKNVIVITDEYKKKCTEHHIVVKKKIDKKKKQKSRSMEDLSTPEIQRREFISPQKPTQNPAVTQKHSNQNNKINETHKTRSKSVDDISTSSNEVLEGVDSVELIFISDEFLNKASKEESEVIIVDDPSKMPSPRPTPSPNSQSTDEKLTNGSGKNNKKYLQRERSPKDKKIYKISDDFKNKSLNNTVIIVKQRDKKKPITKTIKKENSLTLNLKTTATNSNTFLTYEEPWSPEDDLESKRLP